MPSSLHQPPQLPPPQELHPDHELPVMNENDNHSNLNDHDRVRSSHNSKSIPIVNDDDDEHDEENSSTMAPPSLSTDGYTRSSTMSISLSSSRILRHAYSRQSFSYVPYDISYHPGCNVCFFAPPRQRQRWGDTQILPRVNWGDLFFDLFYGKKPNCPYA